MIKFRITENGLKGCVAHQEVVSAPGTILVFTKTKVLTVVE